MKICFICGNYLSQDGMSVVIGGVETYISTLISVLQQMNFECIVIQTSATKFEKQYKNATIIGCGEKSIRRLVKFVERYPEVDSEKDIFVFSTDFLLKKNNFEHTIAIQHGVAWDITKTQKTTDLDNIVTAFKSAFRTVKKYKRYKNCNHLVCVDYNFINWYRTQVAHIDTTVHIIPNYSKIPKTIAPKFDSTIRIIFARRLVEYRGTRLFTYAIKEVLKKHPEIEVTIAGEGPEESWMRDQLADHKQVSFICYQSEDSLAIHQRHTIAVIPTRGSEGTSLSLLEAMAAGCAVIATNVGGMTNIILDEYNGLMISPEVNELTESLLRLIENRELRNRIAQKGRETITEAFSFEKWQEKWLHLIGEISNE